MADDNESQDNVEAERAFVSQLQERASRVDAAIRSGKTADAMRLSLADPPFASKDAAVKDKSFEVFVKAAQAMSAKEESIAQFLDSLSDADAADACMKYIIRGLKTADNSALFFRLHGYVLEKAGTGCLVRAMVDRKTA